jgi:hypothetical protein
LKVQKRQQKNELVYSNYKELENDYETEINRLSFIVSNEVSLKNVSIKTICPFCENKMTPKNPISYIQAAKAELKNILNNLNDLNETAVLLKDSLDDDSDLIECYKDTIEKNKQKINEHLIPKRNELAKKIQEYEEYIKLKSALDEIVYNDNNLEEDLEKYKNGNDIPNSKFEAKKILFSILSEYIKDYGIKIFNDVNYPNICSIELQESTLDLVVNNKSKIKRGKGYKAFTNSMCILLLRQYIEEKGAHKGCFWFLDSPLKGLSLPEYRDFDPENIRIGFFNYLINLETKDQIIVIENTKDSELPKLDLKENVMVYKFTQNENNGRYGFLKNVKKE